MYYLRTGNIVLDLGTFAKECILGSLATPVEKELCKMMGMVIGLSTVAI